MAHPPERIPEHFVDAHHHLWDLSACHYPWLMERGVKRFFGDPTPIQKDYLVSDFRTDIGDLPVVKSVHIQVGVAEEDAVKETQWVQAQAEAHGLPNAIVAFCDLTKPGFKAQLDAHQQLSGLRGVRQIVGRDAIEDAKLGTNSLLSNPSFKDGLQALVARGLSFDLQLTPPLLKTAAALFKAVDDLPVALCHAGSLQDFSADGVAAWRSGLKAFAETPNAICKISGFGMFQPNWTPDTVRDHVLSVIDIFGPDRVAFGSNFPVDKLSASYGDNLGAYLEVTSDFSAAERTAMFAGTAERFYRI
ncbi:MAG: amidohydrolase family protein [Pseudomonadota bacterium]